MCCPGATFKICLVTAAAKWTWLASAGTGVPGSMPLASMISDDGQPVLSSIGYPPARRFPLTKNSVSKPLAIVSPSFTLAKDTPSRRFRLDGFNRLIANLFFSWSILFCCRRHLHLFGGCFRSGSSRTYNPRSQLKYNTKPAHKDLLHSLPYMTCANAANKGLR